MLSTFMMLFVGFLALYTDFDFRVRVQCRLHRIFIPKGKPLPTICMVLVFVYLVTLTLSKSLGFCFGRRGPFSSIRRLIFYAVFRKEYRSFPRKDYFAQRLKAVSTSQSSLMLRYINAYFLTFNFVYSELLDSFLWEILWLFFHNMYGIRQLFWARKYVRGFVLIENAHEEDKWGFGQLLALFLLVLPVLAAAEVYRGMSEPTYRTQMLTLRKLDAKGKGTESSIPLGPVFQFASNTRPETNRVSSTSRLVVPSDDNNPSDEHSHLSHPVPDISSAPWGLRDEDPYEFPLFWIIIAGLVLYTLTTMILVAWYLAWHIGPEFYPGIEASICMAGVLLVAAAGPFYQEYKGFKNHPH